LAYDVSWDNCATIFESGSFPRNLLNSVVVATLIVASALLLAVTAAYALSRVRFQDRSLLLLTILSVSMFPQMVVLAGLFEVIRFFGLFNSIWGLIFSYMIFTLPFTVWVLTTFMRELPVEIEEAAIVDGASAWIIVTRVFMPLMWPALVTTGLLAFIAAWNEFLFALTFTSSNLTRTVPVAIALLSGASQFEIPWGTIMAASVIVTLPLVGLVLIFQREIISGLTAGGVKG
jgi:trehalose/maltose transport system permease protein